MNFGKRISFRPRLNTNQMVPFHDLDKFSLIIEMVMIFVIAHIRCLVLLFETCFDLYLYRTYLILIYVIKALVSCRLNPVMVVIGFLHILSLLGIPLSIWDKKTTKIETLNP